MSSSVQTRAAHQPGTADARTLPQDEQLAARHGDSRLGGVRRHQGKARQASERGEEGPAAAQDKAGQAGRLERGARQPDAGMDVAA